MYVAYLGHWGWQVLRADQGRAVLVAGAIDEAHADRIAQLLERHGMTDVPLDEMEGQAG